MPFKISSFKIFLPLALITLFVIGLGLYKFTEKTAINYQAVFLDNGQVYFGKVEDEERTYVIVTDVYYFGRDSGDPGGTSSDLTLIKLGSELHGPTNKMKILRDHILFLEELSDESRVVAAIKDYKGKE